MKETFSQRISNDLKESQISWIVVILFIPIAFITYFFHEFGHWTLGELFGNEMVISLNNSAPKSGYLTAGQPAPVPDAPGTPEFQVESGSTSPGKVVIL